MPATATVLYARKEGGKFDADYYLKTHMPLAWDSWKEFGFLSYKVTKFSDESPFMYGTTMEFESMEGFGRAFKSEKTQAVLDDVPKFTNLEPTIAAGEVIGTN
jgi:uncharacterized protein (TIGR02118 family)